MYGGHNVIRAFNKQADSIHDFEEINEELSCTGMKLCINSEYAPECLKEATEQYAEAWRINETMYVHGRGHRKTTQQRHYEKLREYATKLEEYVKK